MAADPIFQWTKTMGGSGTDQGWGVTTDSSGNIYQTGSFQSTVDFDPGTGTDNQTAVGGYDIFLTKINADGSYGWTKTMGGSGSDYGRGVITDSSGNIYMTGYFSSTVDFDPGTGTDNHTTVGVNDIFLTKINADGSYGWTKTMGGSGTDQSHSVTTDSSGDIYLTGNFQSTVDFDPGTGTDNHTTVGGNDIFLTKINADGSYGWTKTMGGSIGDQGLSITIDSSGNSYLTGYFSSTVDFDPGAGTDNKTAVGSWDIFLTKINADGSYGWTKTMGGSGFDYGYSVTTDSSGDIYLTGNFQNTVDFDPGTGTDNKTAVGSVDISLTKINADGSYGWTKTMGGSGSEEGHSVTTDSSGNIYLTGYFSSTVDFDPGTGTDNQTAVGDHDIFLTKINADGSYGWTKTMGGSGDDQGSSVTTDSSGNIYLTGPFSTTVDFDPGTGTDNHTAVGSTDIFLTKFSQPTPTPTNTSTSSNTSTAKAPECADTKPASSPNLFQIDVTDTSAKLFFAPAKDPVNKYFIAYSLNMNVLMYGVEYSQGYSGGVLSYTINLLKPNTTYYFKVRGGNGCMTGDWSGTLGVKTTSSKFTKKSFYLWSCLNGKTNPLACIK